MTTTEVDDTAASCGWPSASCTPGAGRDRPATLPVPQAAVLGWLDRDGPMTTSELAAAQSVRHQSAARVVGQLADLRMVYSAAPQRRAQTGGHLTAAGRRASSASGNSGSGGSATSSRPSSRRLSSGRWPRASTRWSPCWNGDASYFTVTSAGSLTSNTVAFLVGIWRPCESRLGAGWAWLCSKALST